MQSKTRLYGENFAQKYSVKLSEIKSIDVFYDQFINGFNFTTLDGQTLSIGNTRSRLVKQTINLENRKLVALKFRSGSWIDGLKFGFEKPEKDAGDDIEWTAYVGGLGGNPYEINLGNQTPNAQKFQITELSGSYDYQFIRSLVVTYEYLQSWKLINFE